MASPGGTSRDAEDFRTSEPEEERQLGPPGGHQHHQHQVRASAFLDRGDGGPQYKDQVRAVQKTDEQVWRQHQLLHQHNRTILIEQNQMKK